MVKCYLEKELANNLLNVKHELLQKTRIWEANVIEITKHE